MTNRFGRFEAGTRVRSDRFGLGHVELDKDVTTIVRFDHGLEECEKTTLTLVESLLDALTPPSWHAPLPVIAKAQAAAIQSVNDRWGVFSRSRIALLPHQLWVCRRVISTWPTRWLVADDVGLGKTIEAGLILWPLLSKGVVRRLLILCPASLVEQWQYRLRTMFDIRLAQYVREADTERADFWNTHNQVVVSLQTLRADRSGRHDRLFESPPWDLLIADEAHHLNADEEAGPTLGYKLVQRLVEERKVSSMVFFTGTPHRGKNFGFLALLRLLRPELFDPRRPIGEQLPRLREVMIRNNKQNVTDLRGRLLFHPPIVSAETYRYSEAEARFYNMLTEFIFTGKAYASSLAAADRRLVTLVLIAMQKLASSSVAAIRRALKGRLARIEEQREKLQDLQARLDRRVQELASEYDDLEQLGASDEINRLEEKVAILAASIRLMEDEEPRLRELVAAADQVTEETKIKKIVSLLEISFANRPVLFFTEYKATQSLLISALMQRFGDECVTFINGDERAEGVVDSNGVQKSISENRQTAAERFNSGRVRFLVSTEAGGEGIDLQERCHSLIHVDLPWNPMRLHQRVGRLNRYGQTQQVEVITMRNPDTVESRIWDKLNAKIGNIMLALGHAMDEPEDLLQLVLGMTSPSLFRELFTEALDVAQPSLSSWFDHKTASFGGRDVIATVKELVGHCSRFDFQQVSSELPPLDLPALRPFLEAMLVINRRRARRGQESISFRTPEAWLNNPGVRTTYEDLIFDRQAQGRNAVQRVLGVGHKVIDQALRQALEGTTSVATISKAVLRQPLVIFRITDRVTGGEATERAVVAGVELSDGAPSSGKVLRDWEVLERLNGLALGPGVYGKNSASPEDVPGVKAAMEVATTFVESQLQKLDLPFKLPTVEILAVLWPVPPGLRDPSQQEPSLEEGLEEQ